MGLRLLRRLLFVLAGLALVGCSAAVGSANSPSSSTNPSTSPSATFSSSTTTTAPPSIVTFKTDATATVAVARLPSEFNPLTPQGSNPITAMVMANVWPATWVIGDRLPPSLCQSATPSCASVVTQAEITTVPSPAQPNRQVVTYTINPKAKWSDGVPITSDDFIYEWGEQLSVGPTMPAGNPTLGYQDIASISPPASKTFTVTFSKPYADWPALFSELVPAHLAVQYGWSKAFQLKGLGPGAKGLAGDHVVSGGPFAVTRFVPGRLLELSRNPHYWGAPARLAHIIFKVEPTEAATLRALRRGYVDVAELPPGPAVDSVVASSTDLNETTVNSPLLEQLVFNLADPTVGVQDVREAIAKSIDRHQLVANTIGLVAPTALVGNRFYPTGAGGGQPDDGQYQAVDLAEADSLLRSAGYGIDANGVVQDPTGKPLTLTLTGPSGNPLASAIEQQLQAELLQAGIHLSIHNISQESLLGTVLPKGAYQLALAPYLYSPYPSTTSVLYGHPVGPSPAPTPKVTNAGASARVAPAAPASGTEPAAVVSGSVTRDVLGFSDPAVDALFAQAASELNATAAASLYNEIDTDLWSVLPTLPLFEMPTTVVVRDDLLGVTVANTWAGPLWDAGQWAVQASPPPTTSTTS